jgi:MFS family permease
LVNLGQILPSHPSYIDSIFSVRILTVLIFQDLTLFRSTLRSSIYTPAFPTIQHDFNVSSTVALFPFSFYVFALGFGPILAAPVSETFGRQVIYLVSTPIGALFTMGSGLSKNIWTLCILRFFAGLAFSPALAIGAGTIADVTRAEGRATPTTIYILTPFLGPALG